MSRFDSTTCKNAYSEVSLRHNVRCIIDNCCRKIVNFSVKIRFRFLF